MFRNPPKATVSVLLQRIYAQPSNRRDHGAKYYRIILQTGQKQRKRKETRQKVRLQQQIQPNAQNEHTRDRNYFSYFFGTQKNKGNSKKIKGSGWWPEQRN